MPGLLCETEEHKKQILEGFKEEFGVEVEVLGNYLTLPGHNGEGGRSDVVVEIPDNIIGRAAVHWWHLSGLFRWYDDYLEYNRDIVPPEALEKFYSEKPAPGGITREEFEAYEKVRESGATNMFDARAVERLSDYVLDKKKIGTIMSNYDELCKFYPGVREEVE